MKYSIFISMVTPIFDNYKTYRKSSPGEKSHYKMHELKCVWSVDESQQCVSNLQSFNSFL